MDTILLLGPSFWAVEEKRIWYYVFYKEKTDP